jgi:transcriptional regulator with XRE-family HTH domain
MDNLKRNCIPSVDILANIAIFLNISVDELIGLTEQLKNKQ